MIEPPPQSRPLDRLRALVMADERLQAELAPIEDPAQLSERVLALAAANGIALAASDLADGLRPDPLGISHFSDPLPSHLSWPSPAWRPVAVTGLSGRGAAVDWARFGDAPWPEAFFGLAARRVSGRPFNRLFRYRMRLEDFVAAAARAPAPDGFIFHMSRSGSTLVARMLAALPQSLVISEAPPLDAMVRLADEAASPVDAVDAVRAMTAALGRRAAGSGPCFIKLHFWHASALPLFRRAYPAVPWLFLHRNPVEVLVSQMGQRGAETMPKVMPILGIDATAPGEEQVAQALARICAGAMGMAATGGGLFVDYADLPGAVVSRILPHFGVDPDEEGRAAMAAAALRDAKRPSRCFEPDAAAKRREATEPMRRAVGVHLAHLHERLKALGGEAIATR
ncbi:MAG: hypothetical protein QOH81_3325 [Sphingomonadales bacterium]|jgi:hypothetical protein|nr:hypothetical protein [Sphingomonadales bacterium]